MRNLAKVLAVLMLTMPLFVFALEESQVKDGAKTYLNEAKQQAQQNDSDLSSVKTSSTGNGADFQYKKLKWRIDSQSVVVEKQKAHIDGIIKSGRRATQAEIDTYERSIVEYAKRIKDLEDWVNAN